MRARLLAPLLLVAAVGVALALTAGDGSTTGDGGAPGRAVADVTVARLDGGGDFALSKLTRAEKPTLLWFWAPWCEICNHEAPAIERLASESRGDLAVVGIGGRDDIANGPAFVARHRLHTPTMLFDEPMAAWRAFAIPAQPAFVLLDRSGRERRRWLGALQPAEVLNAAREL